MSFRKFFILFMTLVCVSKVNAQQVIEAKKLVPAQNPTTEITTSYQLIHVPKQSTFFWDSDLFYLKRRNPQGYGVLDSKKSEIFQKAIKLQDGTIRHKGTKSFFVSKPAPFHFKDKKPGLSWKISKSQLEDDTLRLDIQFDESPIIVPDQKEPIIPKFESDWSGEVPLGKDLYFVLRSRDLKCDDNYVVILNFVHAKDE